MINKLLFVATFLKIIYRRIIQNPATDIEWTLVLLIKNLKKKNECPKTYCYTQKKKKH